MALTKVTEPFAVFTDTDGSPLDGGFIYVGTVDQNPETSPITVYYDEALSIPAAQPLRTSNGYVMRSGSPAVLYVDVDYSITVRDKNGALVIATQSNSGTTAGTRLLAANNLSDVDDAAASLVNLGLTATAEELNFVDGVTSNVQTQLNAKAPLASPSLTGTPTSPTASAGTSTTQIATMEALNSFHVTNVVTAFGLTGTLDASLGSAFRVSSGNISVIENGVNGQHIYITAAGSALSLTVYDLNNGSAGVGANIALNSTLLALSEEDTLHLFLDNEIWRQVAYSQNRLS